MDYLSWQWGPHIAECKLFLISLRAELAILTLFFAKCIFCTCLESKNKYGMFFSFTFNPPNIKIDPYIWQTPFNDLITGLEDLAFNAWTLQNIGIGPYIWQTPSYVLITGLENLVMMRFL